MFTSLLKLLGLGKKTIDKSIPKDDEPITQELIDTTSGEELYTKIVWNLLGAEVWFSDSQKAFFFICELDGEVCNGGFNEYYFNPSGANRFEVEKTLELVGAVDFLNLMKRANACYETIKPELEKFDDGTVENFSKSYEDNPFSEFDDEYYELNRDGHLFVLMSQFVKKHPQDFISKVI